MLLALRLLYETSAAAVTPPPAGRVFHGSPTLGRPLFVVNAEAFLPSSRFRSKTGEIVATGTAQTALESARAQLMPRTPSMSGDGTAKITGARARLRNNHDVRHSSVVLGANRMQPDDEEEAALLLFLSNQ